MAALHRGPQNGGSDGNGDLWATPVGVSGIKEAA